VGFVFAAGQKVKGQAKTAFDNGNLNNRGNLFYNDETAADFLQFPGTHPKSRKNGNSHVSL
jgi:hypothetical protein